jgi:hypothetical protein
MMRIPSAAALSFAAVIIAGSPTHAQSWSQTERECASEINRQLGCASCGGAWPQWARCTVERFYGDKIPSARLEACMQKIWDWRWEHKVCASCGDPVASSIRCAGGG